MNKSNIIFSLLCLLVNISSLLSLSHSHGCMTQPNPRGSLTTRTSFIRHLIDTKAPIDYYPHFPAGPRSRQPGTGLTHQRQNALPEGWVPFAPSSPNFKWRSAVCGDAKNGPFEHEKGGRYYYNGKVVANYTQGGKIEIQLGINAHHNGYMAVHVCDVGKCPRNEISAECFQQGHCYLLQRTPVDKCESAMSTECGPIDRKFPERWYFPCYGHLDGSGVIKRYGEHGEIAYHLPGNVACEHCVLLWYWTSANTCNPPGVKEYFDGEYRPHNWGRCKGQGGAVGGVARTQKLCGNGRTDRKSMPEEYFQCADIRISSAGSKGSDYNDSDMFNKGRGSVRDIVLVDEGRRVLSLNMFRRIRLSKYKAVSIEAVVDAKVKRVLFKVGKRRVHMERARPFYIQGRDNSGLPRTWNPPVNQWIKITVIAGRDRDSVNVYFEK